MINVLRFVSVAGLNDCVVAAGGTLFLALLVCGCRVVRSTAELDENAVSTLMHGKKDQQSVDLVELHKLLMRFADERFSEAGFWDSTGWIPRLTEPC